MNEIAEDKESERERRERKKNKSSQRSLQCFNTLPLSLSLSLALKKLVDFNEVIMIAITIVCGEREERKNNITS